MKAYREYLQDAKRLYDKLGYAAPETHVDRIAEALRSAASQASPAIPMPQHELDALIQRNEERKRINTEYMVNLRSSGFGWPEDGPPDPPPCEPSVMDDIDHLLALIADLQAALADLK